MYKVDFEKLLSFFGILDIESFEKYSNFLYKPSM